MRLPQGLDVDEELTTGRMIWPACGEVAVDPDPVPAVVMSQLGTDLLDAQLDCTAGVGATPVGPGVRV
jgi:hypothetical protein